MLLTNIYGLILNKNLEHKNWNATPLPILPREKIII